jgi:glucosamine--fructose-6-phosphate aminotransferase (isomerizing)
VTEDWYDPEAFPELRSAPPWVMQEMIEAEPALVEQIAAGSQPGGDPSALALLCRNDAPVSVVGCGTSEHASLGVAEMLREAGIPAVSREAFEASLEPLHGGSVFAVSHEGGTWATGRALRAARAAGSATGLITARPESESTVHADAVLVTPLVDRSWCHTVGYISPLTAALALAGAASGTPVDVRAVGALVAAGLDARDAAAAAAAKLHGCDQLLIVGSGADRTSARELTLKIEEACHLPTAMRDLETLLHGHLPATGSTTGVVLILADRRAHQARSHRAKIALRACARIGIACAAITTDSGLADLAPAGVVPVPTSDGLPAAAAALLGAAVPLQLFTLELAHARNTNPDLIRREQAPYREAAGIVESSG